MSYERTFTRQQRIAREGNIPGSLGWTLKKNDGQLTGKTVIRNNLKFVTKRTVSDGPNYQHIALNDGWKFNEDTQTWKHPMYENLEFPSIYQTICKGDGWDEVYSIPYCNNSDPHGLAYNYTITGGGAIMKITPNKWVSEEFDTRHGRRRELWRQKKELRKKYALQFQAYKEQQRDAERAENEEEYNREFTIQD